MTRGRPGRKQRTQVVDRVGLVGACVQVVGLTHQGRCLLALGKPDAEEPLREARELFASMGYQPALAETEALLSESQVAAV